MDTHSGQGATWKEVAELHERRDVLPRRAGKSFVEQVTAELGLEGEVFPKETGEMAVQAGGRSKGGEL